MQAQNVLVHLNSWKNHPSGKQSISGMITSVNGDNIDATLFAPGSAPEFISNVQPGKADNKKPHPTYELVNPPAAPAAKEPKEKKATTTTGTGAAADKK